MIGGYGKGNRYRWWYRLTGLPGWMRFSYPYMTYPLWGYPPFEHIPYTRISPEDELQMLEEERQMLEDELEEIRRRIEEIKKEIKRR
ncbi:MAG: hypothetical protein DRN08_01580 [Thermoplasmata archaeon]|nr:MAG: hypothetical protein DRN08_01580 [Thermoplasmata archaeon]